MLATVVLLLLVIATARAADPPAAVPPPPPLEPSAVRALTEPTGHWSGFARFEGDSTDFHLVFTPKEPGRVVMTVTLPATNLFDVPLGRVTADGDRFRASVLSGQFVGRAGSASDPGGRFVGSFAVAGCEVTFDLARDSRPAPAIVPPIAASSSREPAWSFATGGPIWSAPTVHDGVVYFGGNDGRIHALDAATGRARWQFQTGGPVVAKPTVTGAYLYVASDDGWLYKIEAGSGREVWRCDTHGGAVKRAWPSLTVEGYDSQASAALVADGLVYVGSADGHLYAIDDATGSPRWDFATGGIIRSTPVMAGNNVVVGSHDHFVYAVNARTGTLAWKHDKQDAVVSTAAVVGNQVLIGGRDSLLEALDAATGQPLWKRFYWLSWVESSAVVAGDMAYIGSSDYQKALAINAATGRVRWTFDTDGSAWSTPAVDSSAVYIGAVGTPGYFIDHRGGFFALDRDTGRELWRICFPPIPGSFTNGVASSPAVGGGCVYFGGLDGTFRAVKLR
ncbi:MAG TPA: PQQ-binding-like beta-propeller repeat protein [Candidatus Eisenbacteria bacterium]